MRRKGICERPTIGTRGRLFPHEAFPQAGAQQSNGLEAGLLTWPLTGWSWAGWGVTGRVSAGLSPGQSHLVIPWSFVSPSPALFFSPLIRSTFHLSPWQSRLGDLRNHGRAGAGQCGERRRRARPRLVWSGPGPPLQEHSEEARARAGSLHLPGQQVQAAGSAAWEGQARWQGLDTPIPSPERETLPGGMRRCGGGGGVTRAPGAETRECGVLTTVCLAPHCSLGRCQGRPRVWSTLPQQGSFRQPRPSPPYLPSPRPQEMET